MASKTTDEFESSVKPLAHGALADQPRPWSDKEGARPRFFSTVRSLIVIAAAVVVWEAIARAGLFPPIKLPSFSTVVVTLFDRLVSGDLIQAMFWSCARVFGGFFIGLMLAMPLGLLIGWSRRLEQLLNPLVEVLRPVPPLALGRAARPPATAAVRIGAVVGLVLTVTHPAAALDDLRRYVFVPDRSTSEVAIIDTESDELETALRLDQISNQLLLPTDPSTSRPLGFLLASNTADDSIAVVDLGTLAVVRRIELGDDPDRMEIDRDGEIVATSSVEAGKVFLVSLRHGRVLRTVSGLHGPDTMVFGPDGKLLYVGNLGSAKVSVIDVASGEVVGEIPIGPADRPTASSGIGAYTAGDRMRIADPQTQRLIPGVINLSRTSFGSKGFASHGASDTLTVIDLRTQEKVKTLVLGDMPSRTYATADSLQLISLNNGDGTISVISMQTLEEVARIRGAQDMTGVNTGWFETTAVILSRAENKALVVDLTELRLVAEIPLPSSPEIGVTTPDGTKVYIALSGTAQVAVIDVARRRLVKLIDGVGREPWGLYMAGAISYCH